MLSVVSSPNIAIAADTCTTSGLSEQSRSIQIGSEHRGNGDPHRGQRSCRRARRAGRGPRAVSRSSRRRGSRCRPARATLKYVLLSTCARRRAGRSKQREGAAHAWREPWMRVRGKSEARISIFGARAAVGGARRALRAHRSVEGASSETDGVAVVSRPSQMLARRVQTLQTMRAYEKHLQSRSAARPREKLIQRRLDLDGFFADSSRVHFCRPRAGRAGKLSHALWCLVACGTRRWHPR